MINFDFKKECYQCSLCEYVCPVNAVTSGSDLFPYVDADKCIKCGLCEKKCVKMNESPYEKTFPFAKGFLCKNKDNEKRLSSSSGGVFIELAEYAVSLGMAVCGCIYDNDFMTKHIVSDTPDGIEKMKVSKYITSDLSGALKEIGDMLKNGRSVLFTGTPCQVAAVNGAFGKDARIINAAVACHGTADRDLWKAFLKEEEKNRGKIKELTLRDKSKGWKNLGFKIKYEDGSETVKYRDKDGYFMKCFTDGLFERDRCLTCMYKGTAIDADIILADAWGMDKHYPDFCDSKGTSAVLCLTEKGESMLNAVKDKFEIKETDPQLIINGNQRIVSPPTKNRRVDSFREDFEKGPDRIQELCKKYGKPTAAQRLKRCINRMLGRGKNK